MLKYVRHSRLYLASPGGGVDPLNALLKAGFNFDQAHRSNLARSALDYKLIAIMLGLVGTVYRYAEIIGLFFT